MENRLMLTAPLLCGLKNFNGVESCNHGAFPGLVNKLLTLNTRGQTFLQRADEPISGLI